MALNDFIKGKGFASRELKRAPVAIAGVSDTGIFEGYASIFNIVDLGRDLVLPGAFRETLARRGAHRIKMLWQHEAREPIGSWSSIQEDARGLKVTGRLNLEVARAREIHSLMRQGTVDGLSIGFRTEKAVSDKMTGVRRLQKIDLWEISIVTFPMLPQARVSSIKARRAPLLDAMGASAVRACDGETLVVQARWRLAACRVELMCMNLAR